MEKQTTIYFTDKDLKRLELCKEIWEVKTTTDIVKLLIKQEYERIQRYKNDL